MEERAKYGHGSIDLTDEIIAYEQGELDGPQTVRLFSLLVKNGMAWTLQGSYGRAARALILDGFLSRTGDILRYPDDEEVQP
jgi:hypothetical protein